MNCTFEKKSALARKIQERDFAKVGNGLFVEHEVNSCGIVQLLTTSKKSSIKHKESAGSRGERNGKLELGSRPSLCFCRRVQYGTKIFSYEILLLNYDKLNAALFSNRL